MWDLLFWLYLLDASLLINHELDSAYWQEWKLFRLPGGISFFLIIHFPIFMLLLWGAAAIARKSAAGPVLALVLSGSGLLAFFLHAYFLRKGHPEFNTIISKAILGGCLIVSLALAVTAVMILSG